jgi:aspartate racemase
MTTAINPGKCLGLIGGLGVGAAVHYYVNIAKAHHALDRMLDMVMVHAEPPRVTEFIKAGDREGLANYLAGFVLRMKHAGAEFAVVPAVTPHYCIRELIAVSPLPVLNIFDPLNGELAARGLKRPAVLGTRFVIESDLYGEVPGVEFVRPQPDEIDRIHAIYTKLALSGEGSREDHAQLTAIAHELIDRDKADAIILGGTDLSIIFNAGNIDFPYLDCAGLHIRAIADKMLGQDRG